MPVKRIISIILIFAFVVSFITGCSIKPPEKKDASQAEGSEAQGDRTTSGQQDPANGGTQATTAGTLPAGHLLLSAAEPPKLDGFLQSAPDLIGKPGTDFELLETGSPNDWGDIPVPLVNPLGSKSLYSYTKYVPLRNDYIEISWLEGVTEVTQRVYGERWELQIDNEKLTTNYIRWYAKELGATLFSNTDDRVTFRLEKGDTI